MIQSYVVSWEMCYRIRNLFGSLHKCMYLKICSPHFKVQSPKPFILSTQLYTVHITTHFIFIWNTCILIFLNMYHRNVYQCNTFIRNFLNIRHRRLLTSNKGGHYQSDSVGHPTTFLVLLHLIIMQSYNRSTASSKAVLHSVWSSASSSSCFLKVIQ